MINMGAPIVSRGGIMSYLVYDLVGIHTNPATIRNLRATLDETSTYYVKRQVPYLEPAGNPILDPETKKPIRKYAPVVERVPGPVLECAFGLLDKGLFVVLASQEVRTPVVRRLEKRPPAFHAVPELSPTVVIRSVLDELVVKLELYRIGSAISPLTHCF